jgi:hypothetical protein
MAEPASLRVRATLSQEAFYRGGAVTFRLLFELTPPREGGGTVIMHWSAAQVHGHLSVDPRRDAVLHGVNDVPPAAATSDEGGSGSRAERKPSLRTALGSGPAAPQTSDVERLEMFAHKVSQGSRSGVSKARTFRCIFASAPIIVASRVRVKSGSGPVVCACSIPLPHRAGAAGRGDGDALLPSCKCNLFRVHYVLSIGVCPGGSSASATRVLRIPIRILAPPPSKRKASPPPPPSPLAAPWMRAPLIPRLATASAQEEYDLGKLREWRSGAGENEFSVRHPCTTAAAAAARGGAPSAADGETQVSRYNISKEGSPLVEVVVYSPRFGPGQTIFGVLRFAAPEEGAVPCFTATIGLQRSERLVAAAGGTLPPRGTGQTGTPLFTHDETVTTWHRIVRGSHSVPFALEIPCEACAEFSAPYADLAWGLAFDFAVARPGARGAGARDAAVTPADCESVRWRCPLAVRNERAPRFAAAAPQSCDELLMPTASGHLLFAVLGDDGK